MVDIETRRIAEVIYNKIYNGNIFTYEQCALNGETYHDKILNAHIISMLDIERAIDYSEDLNQIYDIEISKYLPTNLNEFLTRVTFIREYGIDSYITEIENGAIGMIPYWLPLIIECFTYEEGLKLKKAFVKRMVGFIDTDFMSSLHIDNLFFDELNKLRLENEEDLTRK